MLYLSFFFTLFLYVIIIFAGFIQDKLFNGTVIHVDRIDAECRGKSVPCLGFFQGVKITSTIVFIENFTLVIKEGGFKKLQLTIIITRCRAKENLDSCEEYIKQSHIDVCRAIDPNNFITSTTASIGFPLVPPVKCPLKKGIYHAYNFSYDLAPFILFNLNGWYWKTVSEVFSTDQNKLVFCLKTDAYVTNSKSKEH